MSEQIQTPTNEQILAENGVAVAPEGGQSTANEPAQLQREYVVQTETGQVYKGKTQADVIEQLKKAVEEGTKTIAQFNREKKTIVEQPRVEPREPQYSEEEMIRIWGEKGFVEAQRYARQFDPDYRQTRQELEEIRTQRTIDAFKSRHDDLPLDDASTSKFEEIYNKFNLPLSVDNLELVWAFAVQSGQLKPATQQQAAAPAPAPPPTLDGSIPAGGDSGINPNTMPLDQLEAMLRRGGQ